MLKLNTKYVTQVSKAAKLPELYPLLQNAIELEHATIPPYLTAMFSIKPGTENEIRSIIHSIVIEEMLHMTIACNILNALGGAPLINKKDFVPSYPGQLPMGIGDGLIVGLAKYSKEQVKKVFMEIEEPENPIKFEVKNAMKSVAPEFHTIGEFYEALKQKIIAIAPERLPGDASKQVTSSFYSDEELFPIITKDDATKAIDIIVEQGEGTSTSPIDFEGELAHYYKFEELYVGKQLVKDEQAPNGYSFSGPDIPYNKENVQPIYPNTKAKMLAPGSQERRRVDELNESYKSLLDGLHTTFNGQPEHLNATLGLMFDIKLTAEKLCGTPFPGKEGYTIGPSFEFID